MTTKSTESAAGPPKTPPAFQPTWDEVEPLARLHLQSSWRLLRWVSLANWLGRTALVVAVVALVCFIFGVSLRDAIGVAVAVVVLMTLVSMAMWFVIGRTLCVRAVQAALTKLMEAHKEASAGYAGALVTAGQRADAAERRANQEQVVAAVRKPLEAYQAAAASGDEAARLAAGRRLIAAIDLYQSRPHATTIAPALAELNVLKLTDELRGELAVVDTVAAILKAIAGEDAVLQGARLAGFDATRPLEERLEALKQMRQLLQTIKLHLDGRTDPTRKYRDRASSPLVRQQLAEAWPLAKEGALDAELRRATLEALDVLASLAEARTATLEYGKARGYLDEANNLLKPLLNQSSGSDEAETAARLRELMSRLRNCAAVNPVISVEDRYAFRGDQDAPTHELLRLILPILWQGDLERTGAVAELVIMVYCRTVTTNEWDALPEADRRHLEAAYLQARLAQLQPAAVPTPSD